MIGKRLADFRLLWENNTDSLLHKSQFHENIAHPYPVFSKESQVHNVGGDVLSEQFEVICHAPINPGKLLDVIGFLGNMPAVAVKEILEGKYKFPTGMDSHTHLLLEEAEKYFVKTLEDIVATFVTMNNFQDWWLIADKNIQFSSLGVHV